jgi:putative FmdB family regulatory protein
MPIYEYVCSACANRTEILHGVHEAGPGFCPVCGAEGSMRKAFAPPAIVFKGSGWAKKERRSAAKSSSSPSASAPDAAPAGEEGGTTAAPADTAKAAEGATASSSDTTAGGA